MTLGRASQYPFENSQRSFDGNHIVYVDPLEKEESSFQARVSLGTGCLPAWYHELLPLKCLHCLTLPKLTPKKNIFLLSLNEC